MTDSPLNSGPLAVAARSFHVPSFFCAEVFVFICNEVAHDDPSSILHKISLFDDLILEDNLLEGNLPENLGSLSNLKLFSIMTTNTVLHHMNFKNFRLFGVSFCYSWNRNDYFVYLVSLARAISQGTASTFGTGLGFGNTQSSPLFQSTTPTLAQTSSPFGHTSAFGQSASGYGQSNLFSTPSTGFGGNLFSSSSSLLSSTGALGFGQTTPSLSTPFQSAQSAPGGFNFSNFGQSQAAAPSGFGGTPGMFSNTAFGQVPGTQGTVAAQAAPMTNPFGTLPTMPQVSIGRTGTSPSVQYVLLGQVQGKRSKCFIASCSNTLCDP
ncbi:nuclear pore complex protein NUP98A-like [Salvia miltiorrhiza]|uniref:nuclear pore complex protein NUP98A-like n=1 Tax=Salvia miltiorrhiza TaxID=226208 RepID=UPI0025ACED44|nr:nuclear pore complex protein NUP98A-like [Salvia miltiorrhiza]